MNRVDELIDIFETPVDGRVAEIRDFIDPAQLFQDFRSNRGRLNFAAAGFKIVDNVINQLLQREQTGGALFESFRNAAREFAPIEWFVGAIAFHHAQIRALDFLVSGEAITAFETLAAPANAGAVARLSGIDYLIITRAALGATHSVKT
jgi:hypothetical protein